MATSTMKELFRLMRTVNKFTDGQVEVLLNEDEKEPKTEGENDDRALQIETADENDKKLLQIETEDENDETPLESETEDENGEESITFYLIVKPNDGYYKGGRIKFKVDLEDYPGSAPNVTCCNVIYHPNIDLTDEGSNGSVCVNLLGSDWTSEVGLDGCVMAVLFLFYNPQLDDALSPVFSGSDEHSDLSLFAENVKISMNGGEVDGYTFDDIMTDEFEEINRPDEVKDEPLGVSAENITISTPREDADADSTMDKEVVNEADKDDREKLHDYENLEKGEELNKSNYVEQIKDEANTDTNVGGSNPNEDESDCASIVLHNSNINLPTTDIEKVTDRTLYEHHSDPLIPCDESGNKTNVDNENVASSSVQRISGTDPILRLQSVETNLVKAPSHRQTITNYIKTKLNIFSGLHNMINQCRGILPRR